MKKNQLPIFCANCSNLALAELECSPLCLTSLSNHISKAKSPSMIRQTKPLSAGKTRVMGLAKTWPKKDTDTLLSMA